MTSYEVLDFSKGQKLNDGLLKKLNDTLISDGVLDDAGEKQIAKLAVKEWLNELKNAVCKDEGLLDEVAYEAQRMQMKASRFRSSKCQLRKLVFFLDPGRKEREKKIELILARLEYLVKQKDAVSLKEGVGAKPSAQEIRTSLVDESGVLCRVPYKEAILELLLSIDVDDSGSCVITVIGMSGVGKAIIA